MINIGFGPNILLGLTLIIAIAIFHFLRIVKPELSRDEDIFFTTIGFIYSCILLIHGWRLDPILLFSQVILVLIIIAAGWENIRLRGQLLSKSKTDF